MAANTRTGKVVPDGNGVAVDIDAKATALDAEAGITSVAVSKTMKRHYILVTATESANDNNADTLMTAALAATGLKLYPGTTWTDT